MLYLGGELFEPVAPERDRCSEWEIVNNIDSRLWPHQQVSVKLHMTFILTLGISTFSSSCLALYYNSSIGQPPFQ